MTVAQLKPQAGRKIALVGGAKSSAYTPWDDPSWEFWCLGNQLDRYEGKKISRVFEMHANLDHLPQGYAQWLADQGIELVVSAGFSLAGKHISTFPYAKARELFGSDYQTSTASYMMAMAILEG